MKRALHKGLPATIATLTILAMLISPLCSTLCTTPNHCPAETAAAQLGSDDCHRVTMSGNADGSSAITSAMTCARPETIAITPDETNSTSSADRFSALASSIAPTRQQIPFFARSHASLLESSSRFPSTSTPSGATVLRI